MVRVVVAQTAVRVDKARIVRVAGVRGDQPPPVVKFKKVLIGVFILHGLCQKGDLRLNGSVTFAAFMVSQGPVGRQDVL